MADKTYTAKEGARFSNEDAALLGQEIEKLDARDRLLPETLLDRARCARSPLHKLFLWDDTEAAERYRRGQAVYYLRNIEVRIAESPKPVKTVHRIIVRPEQQDDGAPPNDGMEERYMSIDRVLSNDAWLGQIIERERGVLVGAQRRLRQYEAVARRVQAVTDGPLQTAIDMLKPVRAA